MAKGAVASNEPSIRAWTAERVFDGHKVLPNHAVVMCGGRVEVLPNHRLPADAVLSHEPNTTILPGLIDMHTHFMRWQAPLLLAWGVTTIRDVGNDLQWILDQRCRSDDPSLPRILCVGPLLEGPQPCHPLVARRSRNPQEAVAAVRETAHAGVDGIKLYCTLPGSWLAAMVAEARAMGRKTSTHRQSGGILVAARAGVDEFHHLDGVLEDVWPGHPPGWLNVWGLPEFAETSDAQQELADQISELQVTATPTLAYWRSQWRNRSADYDPAEESPGVPDAIVRWQGGPGRNPAAADQWRRAMEAAQQFTRRLLDRGVCVLAGSDIPCGATTPGLSLWRELALLTESGMSALEALQAATSKAAALLGRGDLGRIAPDAAADFVIVRGDPTQRISHPPEIVSVVRDGVTLRPADLLAQANRAAATDPDDPWAVQLRLHAEKQGFPGGRRQAPSSR